MSQFKKIGAFYCSTFGGSALNAGTALAPYAHPSSAPNSASNKVVCSGAFAGGWAGNRLIIPDGPCMFDFGGASVTMNTDLTTTNVGPLKETDLIYIENANLGGSTNFRNCVFKNCTGFSLAGTIQFQGCIFLEHSSGVISIANNFPGGQNCLILENLSINFYAIQAGTGWFRSYLDKDKYIEYLGGPYTTANWNAFGFQRCLFNGRIIANGVNYELKKLKDGTARPDANPAYADIITLYPNVYTNGNYAGDMKFIDILKRKVQPDSDIFYSSLNFVAIYGNIGTCETARYIKPDDLTFQYSFTSNIDSSDPLSLKTAVGQPFGKIRITGKVSDNLITALTIDLANIIKFYAQVAGGVTANNNVPDASRDMSLTLGSFVPRRFTFKVRTSVDANANQASPASIWDNDSVGRAGDWFLCEFNKPIQLFVKSGVRYGNADYRAFVSDSIVNINFRSIDIEVILDQEWDIV